MPDIQITGLTAAQQAEIVAAFISVHGAVPLDKDTSLPIMTNAQWAKSRMFNYIKSTVQEYRRKQVREAQMDSIDGAVNTEFGEIT